MHRHLNLINGEWVGSTTFTLNINPSDVSEVVAEYAQASAEETRTAIAAARAALPGWSRTSLLERGVILRRTADELMARRDELGTLLAREEGKVVGEAIGEVTRAAQIFDFYAGETLRISGEVLSSPRPGITVEITREPVGVVGIITPWNFPIAIPAWKIAPALAFGNTVVFKPADLVPSSAWMLCDILHRAGLPAGVLNLVMGRGSIVGQALLDSPQVNAISFTGSAGVGRQVAMASAALNRKFQLEMGGKNPLIVLDDADLDLAIEAAANSAFIATGQRCTAASRLIVTPGIHDAFVKGLIERMKSLHVDHALSSVAKIGPVASKAQMETNLSYIALARSEGADLAYGGHLLERATEGHFIEPALFTGATNDMRFCQEEIFGPVAGVIAVHDYEEAVTVANDTTFGLTSGIVTQSLKYATDFKRRSEAGMVMVNMPTAGNDFHVPFGGRKGSSYGPREQGRYAAEFYTSIKTAYVQA